MESSGAGTRLPEAACPHPGGPPEAACEAYPPPYPPEEVAGRCGAKEEAEEAEAGRGAELPEVDAPAVFGRDLLYLARMLSAFIATSAT